MYRDVCISKQHTLFNIKSVVKWILLTFPFWDIVAHEFIDNSFFDHRPLLFLASSRIGSSIESTKTSRCGENGTKRIVTRIVRKTTTLTRGEEQRNAEDLTKRAQPRYLQDINTSTTTAITRRSPTKAKTVRVSKSKRYDTAWENNY